MIVVDGGATEETGCRLAVVDGAVTATDETLTEGTVV